VILDYRLSPALREHPVKGEREEGDSGKDTGKGTGIELESFS